MSSSIAKPDLTLHTFIILSKISPEEIEQLKEDFDLIFKGSPSFSQLQNMPLKQILELTVSSIQEKYANLKPSVKDEVAASLIDVIQKAYDNAKNEIEGVENWHLNKKP